jgi:hypothetical protein
VPQSPAQQLNAPAPLTTPADWYANQGLEAPLANARPNPTGFESALGPDGTGKKSFVDKAKDAINSVNPIYNASQLVFSGRLVMLVIGVILIAAGVFSFKQTQTVIDTARRLAA